MTGTVLLKLNYSLLPMQDTIRFGRLLLLLDTRASR